jgi:hypothetical protein
MKEAPSSKRPKIVAICGSTRFIEPIVALAWWLEKRGEIAFFPLYLPPQVAAGSHQAEAEGVKEAIDELFKRKIDLADELVVMDVGGYVGESTRSEIAYAVDRGKIVRRWSKMSPAFAARAAVEAQFPEISDSYPALEFETRWGVRRV